MRTLSSFAAFALVTLAAPPVPQVVIHGRVTATSTQQPLERVQVRVHPAGPATMTGADGRYRLAVPRARRAPGDSIAVRALLIGYQPQLRTVPLAGDTAMVNFALTPAMVQMSEVVVTGTAVAADRLGSRDEARAVRMRRAAELNAAGARAPAVRHPRYADPRAPNTESYDRIVDNPFLSARRVPLSTFSIDVDRASYSNVRRFIDQGQRPPKDAVRIEELVNYFSYDYPGPAGDHPFSVTTEVAPAPWRPAHQLVRIGLQARRIPAAQLPPSNLVFLIDVSGSMQHEAKLPLVKQALGLLVDQLREDDHVAIVVYAGAAGLVLQSTPGNRREEIRAAIDRLEAGGSTAGGAGLDLAYDVARQHGIRGGNNRVILATDGDFNVGPSSDADMERLIERRRKEGTFLSVLGFGMGNYKDSKMEKLADKGNGNYAYIDNLVEARKVLVDELAGTMLTVARDVKLQVEFNPRRVASYRLIGYENRLLRDEDFDDDSKDAGEIGAGLSVTALYEVVPVGAATDPAREAEPLRYQAPGQPNAVSRSPELLYVKLRYKQPDGSTSRRFDHAVRGDDLGRSPSDDFTFAAAVAAYGMVLRDSEHRGTATLDDVLRLARGALGRDEQGYRADFVRLVERTNRIMVAATRN